MQIMQLLGRNGKPMKVLLCVLIDERRILCLENALFIPKVVNEFPRSFFIINLFHSFTTRTLFEILIYDNETFCDHILFPLFAPTTLFQLL